MYFHVDSQYLDNFGVIVFGLTYRPVSLARLLLFDFLISVLLILFLNIIKLVKFILDKTKTPRNILITASEILIYLAYSDDPISLGEVLYFI